MRRHAITLMLVVLMCGAAARGQQGAPEDISVTVFRLTDQCSRLVNLGQAPDAEPICRQAVTVANQLPPEAVLERSSARAWLGHALLLQRQVKEALEQYTLELDLDQRVLKPTEAELASDYHHLAAAHFLLGDLTQSDQELEHAASIMDVAIGNLPSERNRYEEQLRRILSDRAVVKWQLGDDAAAVALQKRAGDLAPMP